MCVYNEMLLSLKKEGNPAIWLNLKNMDDLRRQYAKWGKPDTEIQNIP